MTEIFDLLPCPFCGEKVAEIMEYEAGKKKYFRVRCDECWAQSHGSFHLSRKGAAGVWNTRAAVRVAAEVDLERLHNALERIIKGGTAVLISATLDESPISPEVLEQIVKDAALAVTPADGKP